MIRRRVWKTLRVPTLAGKNENVHVCLRRLCLVIAEWSCNRPQAAKTLRKKRGWEGRRARGKEILSLGKTSTTLDRTLKRR